MADGVKEKAPAAQAASGSDRLTPIHLVREKEVEIAGRVLACRRQAEEVLADARRKAADLQRAADTDAERLASEREKENAAEIEREVAAECDRMRGELQASSEDLTSRVATAAEAVARMVTGGD